MKTRLIANILLSLLAGCKTVPSSALSGLQSSAATPQSTSGAYVCYFDSTHLNPVITQNQVVNFLQVFGNAYRIRFDRNPLTEHAVGELWYSGDDGNDPGSLGSGAFRGFPAPPYLEKVSVLSCHGNGQCDDGKNLEVSLDFGLRLAELKEKLSLASATPSTLLRNRPFVSLLGECQACPTGTEDYCVRDQQ